jgi:hypothetical protein
MGEMVNARDIDLVETVIKQLYNPILKPWRGPIEKMTIK